LYKCADQNNGRQPAVGTHTGAAGILGVRIESSKRDMHAF